MSCDLLRRHIRAVIAISEADLESITARFQLRTLKKGEFLLRQGNVCRFEGFVNSGCLRTFSIDEQGGQNVLHFATTDWWLMDIDSFMNGTPSDLNIQALENCTILLLSKSDKEWLYRNVPIVEKVFRIIFQKAVVAWQRRLIRNHSHTASQRYHHFLLTYPTIAGNLTDRQIASYLGITHEFLSKIKRS